MPRPRRSTRDQWLDEFSDVPVDVQENWLEMAEFVHRQAKRKRPSKDALDQQTSLTGLPDETGVER